MAKNIVIGLARAGGHSVGVIANQPMQKGGSSTRMPPTRLLGSFGCVTHSTSRSSI